MENPKEEVIELDIPEIDLFNLMLIAHERDITLNQLVNEILTNHIEQLKEQEKGEHGKL